MQRTLAKSTAAPLLLRMLGWSMNLFRIRGIPLAVHFSFVILLALFAYDGWAQEGWVGMAWSLAMLLACFTCVVLHELGHSFTAMHFGIGVRRILLMPIGGMAEFDDIPRQPWRELLITLAGPAVNFAIAGLLSLFVPMPPDWFSETAYSADATGFTQFILVWNLLMGCFNLAPIFPMDGGRILRALLATRLPYLSATRIAATVGKILALAGATIAVVGYDAYLTAVLFSFIFFAGEVEYRMARRRDTDEAHWREVVARLQMFPPPAEEPPLLMR